jgi:hypothetical protein
MSNPLGPWLTCTIPLNDPAVLSKPFDRNELVDVFRQIVLMKRQVAPMRIDGLKKVLVGLTTVDAVLRVTPR